MGAISLQATSTSTRRVFSANAAAFPTRLQALLRFFGVHREPLHNPSCLSQHTPLEFFCHILSKMQFSKILFFLSLCLISSQAFSDSISTGTGFYISSDGYFVTNFHVIKGAKDIAVQDRMNQIYRASIVQVDTDNDLAILRVEGKKFTFLAVASSTGVQKGETVFTIGFPNITMQGLESKVTQGIISSLSGIGGQPTTFQISVPIQPGNSGGPLINEYGNVIGIVSSTLRPQATMEAGGFLPQTVNYAIKSNYLLELIATIPTIKRSTTLGQKKLTLPEQITRAEQAVGLVIVAKGRNTAGFAPPNSVGNKPPPVAKSQTPPPPFLLPDPLPEDASEQNKLGEMYLKHSNDRQSKIEAVKWFRLAAEQGFAPAQVNLGAMYFSGRGVAGSHKEAVKWFRLAAWQKFAPGENRLGEMYLLGFGIEQSWEEAVKWFRLAAEQGNAEGQVNLAVMYDSGSGVQESLSEAIKWYRLAAEQGNGRAIMKFVDMHLDGRGVAHGVAQSDEEAVKWLRLAADQGIPDAQLRLGFMYEKGRGVTQSDTEAEKWYRLAAEKGYVRKKNN